MTTHSVFLLDKRVGRNSHWDRMEMKQREGKSVQECRGRRLGEHGRLEAGSPGGEQV